MAQDVGADPGWPRQPGAGNPSRLFADGRPRGRRVAGAGDGGLLLRRHRPKKVAPTDPKRKLRGGERRPLRVRLLGGLLIYVMTRYCSPARRTGKKRGREGSGLYPELGVLGIHEGKSPALVRDVGRLTALLPSYEAVQHELSERGVAMRILGGGTYDTPKIPDRKYFNDVWSSADAVSWTRRSEEAPWQARQYHDVAAFDGRMWVLKGYYKEGAIGRTRGTRAMG